MAEGPSGNGHAMHRDCLSIVDAANAEQCPVVNRTLMRSQAVENVATYDSYEVRVTLAVAQREAPA